VIRRRIDVPWRLRPEDFGKLKVTQLALLERLSGHLAPNGRLVYSTCSLDREENEEVVEAFLEKHPDFRLVSQSSVKPWIDGFDGAFSAALEKRSR
jgi:16S rRNA (cytosine967-C5)-methyltransferase